MEINTTTTEDYTKLKNHFETNNINFYTHPLKGEAEKHVVLKGLINYTPNEIMEDLKEQGLSPTKVTTIRFANKEPPYEFPFFKVTFANEQLKNETKKVKYVLHCKIRWKRYKNPRKSTMCYKCQGHGHGTKSCFQKFKCLKCLEEHDTRDCTIKFVEEKDKKCANCPGNHLSNNPRVSSIHQKTANHQ